MKLRNNFPEEVRLAYLYSYACEDCGRSDRGLELHHIKGRESSCFLNSFLICKYCHAKCGHSFEEEKRYLNHRIKNQLEYQLTPEDAKFYEKNKNYYII